MEYMDITIIDQNILLHLQAKNVVRYMSTRSLLNTSFRFKIVRYETNQRLTI